MGDANSDSCFCINGRDPECPRHGKKREAAPVVAPVPHKKSYAERHVFSQHEMGLLDLATNLVLRAPYEINGNVVRCHELARVVGEILGLEVQDGRYGFVEHSWLWTAPPVFKQDKDKVVLPKILDVYVPGGLPQVQLFDISVAVPMNHTYGNPRSDIDEDVLKVLRMALA